jgi:HEAT repeat protein
MRPPPKPADVRKLLDAGDVAELLRIAGENWTSGESVRSALRREPPSLAQRITPYLGPENPPVLRIGAASALGAFETQEAEQALLRVLKEIDPATATGLEYELWTTAMWMLAFRKSKAAVDVLVEALEIDDVDVRQDAASALGEIGDTRAIEPLTRLLHTSDWSLAWRSEEALKAIGGPHATKAVARSRHRWRRWLAEH